MIAMFSNIAKRRCRRLFLALALVFVTGAHALAGPFEARMAELDADIKAGKFREIHSLLVYYGGTLVHEAYFEGNDDRIDFEGGIVRVPSAHPVRWGPDRKHYVASVTKTVTALLTGIALDELQQPATVPVRKLLPLQQFEGHARDLTVENLLTMQTGFVWDEWAGDDLKRLWRSDDFTAFLLARPNTGPGTAWTYTSAAPNLLLTVLERQLGQPMAAWAHARLFRPLGIRDYDWAVQPTGTPEGAARLALRPRDMLKLGILMLDDGVWRGRRVLPEGWVAAMTWERARPDDRAYGYYIWLNELQGHRYFSAEGDGGQQINIFPADRLIVVMTQGNYLEWPLYADQAKAMMAAYVLPGLGLIPAAATP